MNRMTVEEALQYMRSRPEYADLLAANYLDEPAEAAALRFANSEEWQETAAWLPSPPGRALDLGAGSGPASYALARAGWEVAAVDPNPGCQAGAGAVRALARQAGLTVRAVAARGEQLPFADGIFDLVYCREVLHHVGDLGAVCREAARVLAAGGMFVAVREHVIDDPSDLPAFLDGHATHRLHGGEHARLPGEYLSALTGSGLTLCRVVGSLESIVNAYPYTKAEWRDRCIAPLFRVLGYRRAALFCHQGYAAGRFLLRLMARRASRRDKTPGRLFTFIACKMRGRADVC